VALYNGEVGLLSFYVEVRGLVKICIGILNFLEIENFV